MRLNMMESLCYRYELYRRHDDATKYLKMVHVTEHVFTRKCNLLGFAIVGLGLPHQKIVVHTKHVRSRALDSPAAELILYVILYVILYFIVSLSLSFSLICIVAACFCFCFTMIPKNPSPLSH